MFCVFWVLIVYGGEVEGSRFRDGREWYVGGKLVE